MALFMVYCCVLGQDITLTVPLSKYEDEWEPGNCQIKLTKCSGGGGGAFRKGLPSNPGGVAIPLVA